jgi:hypothetical protein
MRRENAGIDDGSSFPMSDVANAGFGKPGLPRSIVVFRIQGTL